MQWQMTKTETEVFDYDEDEIGIEPVCYIREFKITVHEFQ